MSRLHEIRKRLDEATPRRWDITWDSGMGARIGLCDHRRTLVAHTFNPSGTRLIAHAPEDLRLLLAVADAAVAVMHHGRQHGRECPPDYEDGYPCDGDCDVAFELVRRLDEVLDEVTQEVAV